MKINLLMALMIILPGMADASATPARSAEAFTLTLSTGMLGGQAIESVYDTESGDKMSQLAWKISHLAILQGTLSWEACRYVTLNARGWTSVAAGSGYMDDYDWDLLFPGDPPDHGSHPRTRVNEANEFDLNLQGWLVQGDNYRLGGVAGYQQTRFSWTASGGRYSYHNGSQTGAFPDDRSAVGYRQRFAMPYIGLTGRYQRGKVELGALLKYSDRVRAQDNDEHYLRHYTYRDRASGARYYGLTLDAGYFVTPQVKVFAEWAYSRYAEHRGRLQIFDRLNGGPPATEDDAAEMANKNYRVTAGLQYRF